MLSQDTADCLALANTAILIRLVDELIERGVIAGSGALLRDAVSDLENCPERSSRVEDAIRLINKVVPRIKGPARVG